MKKSYVTVTDMFCGCGGSSQGAVAASAEVVMAANHWRLAIETHNTNFPNTSHDCADISQVVPSRWPTTDVLSSITTVDHHGVVMPEPFLLSYYSRDSAVHAVDEPMGTLSTLDRHALVQTEPFLASYYYNRDDALRPIDEPMGTLPTEVRHALVQPENPSVEDCYFRMLKPEEIKLGMAFGPDYVVLGNGREQVRQCGNAVTPPVAAFLFERCMEIFN